MTPERLQEIRDLTDRRIRLIGELGTTVYPTLQCNIDLLAHIDLLHEEIRLSREERDDAEKACLVYRLEIARLNRELDARDQENK